jgi:hypothetical protein
MWTQSPRSIPLSSPRTDAPCLAQGRDRPHPQAARVLRRRRRRQRLLLVPELPLPLMPPPVPAAGACSITGGCGFLGVASHERLHRSRAGPRRLSGLVDDGDVRARQHRGLRLVGIRVVAAAVVRGRVWTGTTTGRGEGRAADLMRPWTTR